MATTHPTPTPRTRLLSTALLAVAVPVLWSFVVLELPEHIGITLGMVVASLVFWLGIARWLWSFESDVEALGVAIASGIASPWLCTVLLSLLTLPLWPLLLLTGPVFGWMPALPWYGFLFVTFASAWFVPVGVAMGVATWLLMRAFRAPRRERVA